MDTTTWDPVGLPDNPAEVQTQDQKLLKQVSYYQAHPMRPRLVMSAWILVAILCWIAFGISGVSNGDVLIIPIVPVVIYYFSIKSLERQLAEYTIAQQFGWEYSSNTEPQKGNQLLTAYPELFFPGARDHEVSDQFWGTTGPDHTPFWMGQYQYTTGSGKNSHTTYETVYALNLPHPTAADFILSPQNKLLGFFEHPKIATESIDFNKYFRITYKGDRGSVGADIFQVLTPPAQEHLLAFRKATSAFTLLFRGNCMLVSFPGSLSLKYTNFFRKVALDPRDENALTTKLENILQLASEILPCID